MQHSPRRIPGITFSVAIRAVDRIPQATFLTLTSSLASAAEYSRGAPGAAAGCAAPDGLVRRPSRRAGVGRAAAALLLAGLAGGALPARGAPAPTDAAREPGLEVEPAPPRAREVYRVQYPLDAAIIAVTGLGYLVPLELERQVIERRCPCARSEVPRFERWAIGLSSAPAGVAADVTYALALGAPPIADLLALGPGRAWLGDVVVFTEAIAVNGALLAVAKNLVQRPIPAAYAGDRGVLRVPASYRSFYSGHVATVVTALTAASWTLHLRYGERRWPWVVTAAAGLSAAAELVLSGGHFPSDVALGALAGFAVGTLVPALHRLHVGRARLSLAPSGRGLALSGAF